MDFLLLLSAFILFCLLFIHCFHLLFRHDSWVAVYKCPCGNKIENGVGVFDSKFFLDELCYKCGKSKSTFERLGIAQIKVKFFLKEEYKYKKD